MSQGTLTLSDISKRLRHDVFSFMPVDMQYLDEYTNTFINLLATHERSNSRRTGERAEISLSLYQILQTRKDTVVIKRCLHALLNGLRFGRILAVRYVNDKCISLGQLTSILNTLPTHDRLALTHEMLVGYPSNKSKIEKAWLESILQDICEAKPSELSSFIASLTKEGEILAFPLKQALKKTAFWDWINDSLQNGIHQCTTQDFCRVLMTLDSPGLATSLCHALSTDVISPSPCTLRTLANLATARDPQVLNLFMKILKKGHVALAGACLEGILKQQSNAVGKLMAMLRTRRPLFRQAVTLCVPLLNDKAYEQYSEALPESDRQQALIEASAALMLIAPDFVVHQLSCEQHKDEACKKLLPDPVFVASKRRTSLPQSNVWSRLFKSRPKKFRQLLAAKTTIRDIDLSLTMINDTLVENCELRRINFNGAHFHQTKFLRAKMTQSTLSKIECNNAVYTGVTFHMVDFSQSQWVETTFVKCAFNGCHLTDNSFTDCTLLDCRFRECNLAKTTFQGTTLQRTGFTYSTLAGATFLQSKINASRFENTEASSLHLSESTLNGIEFINSILNHASLQKTIFDANDMSGASVYDCQYIFSDLPHPLFQTDHIKQLYKKVQHAKSLDLPTEPALTSRTAHSLLQTWSREYSFACREERMLSWVQERKKETLRKFKQEKRLFLRILPYVLSTSVFELHNDLQIAPQCDIWNYTPSLSTLELVNQYFPDTPTQEQPKPSIFVPAIYVMGSLGTVSQTHESDIDCWICYDGTPHPQEKESLQQKLMAISKWAETHFAVEVHFFLMSMESIRNNIFVAGDEESSGSAQALLLKEEFYRTALPLAGKNLAWWVMPPNTNQRIYSQLIESACQYPLLSRPRIEDFGHLCPIPPSEYFGGTLWQIVKALHSPFKSVLKLGLLELYADETRTHPPLCEQIKHNIFMRRKSVHHIDPYASLFATLRSYYSTKDEMKTADLLVQSFTHKTHFDTIPFLQGNPAVQQDASLLDLMVQNVHQSHQEFCRSVRMQDFKSSLEVGNTIQQYLIRTYKRIQDMLQATENTPDINAQDLTRLGRRISTLLSRKPHKIMQIPFISTTSEDFRLLHLATEKSREGKSLWVIRGGARSAAKKATQNLEQIYRNEDLAMLLAWLLANQIYQPDILLQGDKTIAPLSIADIQQLLQKMDAFFPYETTFEKDINEGLKRECVTKIFFINNLGKSIESGKNDTVTVIYTTNWGEMFCQTFFSPHPEIRQNPLHFLEMNLTLPLIKSPTMTQFAPKGSPCTRLQLP